MTTGILIVSIVLLLCVMAEKCSDKFGMPALILFMFIGMLFGSDGIAKIQFDNYKLTEEICSITVALIPNGRLQNRWWENPFCCQQQASCLRRGLQQYFVILC